MERKEIEQNVIALLSEKGKIEDGEVDLSSPINAYLNSITYIQFIIAVEETFEFELVDEDLDPRNFKNFYDVIERIEKRLT